MEILSLLGHCLVELSSSCDVFVAATECPNNPLFSFFRVTCWPIWEGHNKVNNPQPIAPVSYKINWILKYYVEIFRQGESVEMFLTFLP